MNWLREVAFGAWVIVALLWLWVWWLEMHG